MAKTKISNADLGFYGKAKVAWRLRAGNLHCDRAG
jgi:hypothetical protein